MLSNRMKQIILFHYFIRYHQGTTTNEIIIPGSADYVLFWIDNTIYVMIRLFLHAIYSWGDRN